MTDSAQHIMSDLVRKIWSFISGSTLDVGGDITMIDGPPHNTSAPQVEEEDGRGKAVLPRVDEESYDTCIVEQLLGVDFLPSPTRHHNIKAERERKVPGQPHHRLSPVGTQTRERNRAPPKKIRQHQPGPWTRDEINWMCTTAQKWSDAGMTKWSICGLLAIHRPERSKWGYIHQLRKIQLSTEPPLLVRGLSSSVVRPRPTMLAYTPKEDRWIMKIVSQGNTLGRTKAWCFMQMNRQRPAKTTKQYRNRYYMLCKISHAKQPRAGN